MSSVAAGRVRLIAGTSSGFGRAIAVAALKRGDRVVATARRPDQLVDLADHERVEVLKLDVTDPEQRNAAVAAAIDRFGAVDVLVNNAGRTQVGAVEETSDDELRALFELHFFAPVSLTRAVLPHMRARRSGAVVQISSVGGQCPPRASAPTALPSSRSRDSPETPRDEVAAFGIRTLIVEPGAFRTGLFAPGAAYESAEMPEYAETVGATRAYVGSNDGLQPGDPAKAAEPIITALDADHPPLRLVLGEDAIAGVRTRLDRVAGELAAWAAVGRDTAIDDSASA